MIDISAEHLLSLIEMSSPVVVMGDVLCDGR
jgi:hypothetical protein